MKRNLYFLVFLSSITILSITCSSSKELMNTVIEVEDYSLSTREDDINKLRAKKAHKELIASSIFLLNGKEISYEELRDIDVHRIKNINVITDSVLVAKLNYGKTISRIVEVKE